MPDIERRMSRRKVIVEGGKVATTAAATFVIKPEGEVSTDIVPNPVGVTDAVRNEAHLLATYVSEIVDGLGDRHRGLVMVDRDTGDMGRVLIISPDGETYNLTHSAEGKFQLVKVAPQSEQAISPIQTESEGAKLVFTDLSPEPKMIIPSGTKHEVQLTNSAIVAGTGPTRVDLIDYTNGPFPKITIFYTYPGCEMFFIYRQTGYPGLPPTIMYSVTTFDTPVTYFGNGRVSPIDLEFFGPGFPAGAKYYTPSLVATHIQDPTGQVFQGNILTRMIPFSKTTIGLPLVLSSQP